MAERGSHASKNPSAHLHHRRVSIDDLEIFYRVGGTADSPTLVLLHGFPSASHQYVPLMRLLADQVHVVAPDYPGFGYSSSPRSSTSGGDFAYTFDHLAEIVEKFLDEVGVDRFFVYLFDFGAPVGFRIALRHPDRILGLIAQNGNAYEVGLGPNMQPAVRYWSDREGLNEGMKGGLALDATRAQHLDGVRDPELVDPDTWLLDQYWIDQPGRDQVMLDLLYDYQSNVAAYPSWQSWLRERRPPLLLPWGRNDQFFPEAGARAYLDDVPEAELHLLDTGHFALDDHLEEISRLTTDFIARHAQ